MDECELGRYTVRGPPGVSEPVTVLRERGKRSWNGSSSEARVLVTGGDYVGALAAVRALVEDVRARSRDVAARFADWIDAAHDDIVDQCRIEMVSILDRLQRGGGEM